tara:strand:- start:991 stop:1182 length:192 start_codon:yes stop_codon:yes gene_type:complete
MGKNKKKKKQSQEIRDDVSDLDKAFKKGKRTRGNKRRNEKGYMRDVLRGEYGGEFIDNFEKWN